MNKVAILALASSATIVLPKAAHADDKQLEKRLEALEAKMERMAAIEAENKELKARLQKTEAKLEKVTAQKVATVAPGRSVEHPAAPVASTTPVIAKDAPVTPVPTESNWSGVYAGINAGYGTGEYTNSSSYFQSGHTEYYDCCSYAVYPTVFASGTSSSFVNGGVAGGQAGYNKQFANNIILGIEGEMNWANVFNRTQYSNFSGYGISSSSFGTYSSGQSSYSKTGLDWFGTVRSKFGYAFGNFMPYYTAGLAFGQVSDVGHSTFSSSSYGGVSGVSASKTYAGWAMGAGAEYKLNNNWSVRGEYLYTNFNGPTSSSVAENGGNKSFGTLKISDFGVNHVRAGLNYHTDWLKELPVSLK